MKNLNNQSNVDNLKTSGGGGGVTTHKPECLGFNEKIRIADTPKIPKK
jgi:hypothetical protein